MKRAILAVAAMLAACGGDGPANFTVEGEEAPGQGFVIAAAQAHCGRPLEGVIRWVERSQDGGVHIGFVRWGCETCPMDGWAVVNRVPWTQDAWETPLAHEIGHWCLLTSEEAPVAAWAQVVNDEARLASLGL